MPEKKSYPRLTDNMYATRNKVFRGKMREIICVDLIEESPGVFRVYLWVDNERMPQGTEFTDIKKARDWQKKFVEKITLETEFKSGTDEKEKT